MRIISFKGMELWVSILATINFISLGVFQNQHLKLISFYWIQKAQFELIFLFIGSIIFGFILGTRMYNCIKHLSSLKIFLISDITFLLVTTGFSLYIFEEINKNYKEYQDEQLQVPNFLDIILLVFQILIGMSISLNFIHTMCFLKINSNEFSFLFIPVFLSTGIFINQAIGMIYFKMRNYYILPDNHKIKLVIEKYNITCYIVQIFPILIRLSGSLFLAKQETVRQTENKNKVHIMDDIDEDKKLRVLKSYFTQYYQIIFLIILTTFSGSQMAQSFLDITSSYFAIYIRVKQEYSFYEQYFYVFQCSYCFYGYQIVIGSGNLLIAICNLLFQKHIKIKIHLSLSIGVVCLGLAAASYFESCAMLFLISFGHQLGLGSFLYKIIPTTLPQSSMIQCFSIEFITQFVEACILSVIYKLRVSNSPQVCQNIQQIFEIYFYFNLVGLAFLLFYWKQPKVRQQKEEIQIMLVETKNNEQEQEVQ